MQAHSPNEARIAEITRIVETKADAAALQRHLKEVLESDVFKGSHRSVQFLQFIVDQAIAGRFDSLKERVIGMELFGRSASYDTGDDAIVRVTASDVRRRLHEHYGRYGETSEFRISLPAGSYIPDITQRPNGAVSVADQTARDAATVNPDALAALEPMLTQPQQESVVNGREISQAGAPPRQGFSKRILLFATISVVVLNLALLSLIVTHFARTKAEPAAVFPWSAIFSSSHATELITSDPNIAAIQGLTKSQVSVSDYANHNYIPTSSKLTPEQKSLSQDFLRGAESAGVDAPIAAAVASLAQANSKAIDVRGARTIQMADLESGNNFIFLGSPRSDPWVSFFSDQLDFRFVFDENTQSEFIRNVRPRPNEQPSYVPTALGWGTGDSFAIIALVQNPGQSGQVLLLSGANAEGTEAAGKLVTDLPRFSSMLKTCGISSASPPQHFEILLHLNIMAGSSGKFDMAACHILQSEPGH
jgi:hypothetical protein